MKEEQVHTAIMKQSEQVGIAIELNGVLISSDII